MIPWHRPRHCYQRRHAWLALLAIMLHALMPIAAQAHGSGSARMVELCSVTGIKKIAVPATDLPAAPAHQLQHAHCPVCAAAGASVLPAINPQIFFAALQAAAPPADPRLAPSAPAFTRPASRAPPLAA